MKSIVAITVILSNLFGTLEQDIPETQVPSVVKNTFFASFANTTDVEWEKEKDVYVVEFEINQVEYKAYIDPAGKLLKTKIDIDSSALPKAVIAAIEKNYNGYAIDDADKIEQAGNITYIVELEKGLVEYKVVYSAEGKVLDKKSGIN